MERGTFISCHANEHIIHAYFGGKAPRVVNVRTRGRPGQEGQEDFPEKVILGCDLRGRVLPGVGRWLRVSECPRCATGTGNGQCRKDGSPQESGPCLPTHHRRRPVRVDESVLKLSVNNQQRNSYRVLCARCNHPRKALAHFPLADEETEAQAR